MSRSLKLPMTLAVATVLTVGLAGCSSDSDAEAAPRTPAPTATVPTATAPTSTGSSDSVAGSSAAPAGECAVPGFVPGTKIVVERTRPVVVYAHWVSLAPDSSWRGRDVELGRLDRLPLRVRPDDPDTTLTPAQRDQILASAAGEVEGGRIPETVHVAARIRNDSSRNRTYLVYQGSFRYSGSWATRDCEGTSVRRASGTYSTVSRLRPVRVVACGEPTGGSPIDRHAGEWACRRDR